MIKTRQNTMKNKRKSPTRSNMSTIIKPWAKLIKMYRQKSQRRMDSAITKMVFKYKLQVKAPNAWDLKVPKQVCNPNRPKTGSKTHKATIRSVMTNWSLVVAAKCNPTSTSSFNLPACLPSIMLEAGDALEQQVVGQRLVSSLSETNKSTWPLTQATSLPHWCQALKL